jgi:regulator of sirC expression with transglutaminase-like and TPR domain
MHNSTAQHGADLSDLAAAGDDDIDLALSALRIAMIDYPQLEPSIWLLELDRLAERARRLAPGTSPDALLRGLDAALFAEGGFHGNVAAYYDPRNSFLNDVLERRQGIPITLSVVYVEVGRRLGLPVAGVAFPGHFLVSYFGTAPAEIIDPFHCGTRLDESACLELLHNATGSSGALTREMLAPATHRQILMRMLNNLKMTYMKKGDLVRAVGTMDRILQISPGEVAQFRDRGLAFFQLGDSKRALRDLKAYAEQSADQADRETVESVIGAAYRALANLN